jgi:hypothetical protein
MSFMPGDYRSAPSGFKKPPRTATAIPTTEDTEDTEDGRSFSFAATAIFCPKFPPRTKTLVVLRVPFDFAQGLRP